MSNNTFNKQYRNSFILELFIYYYYIYTNHSIKMFEILNLSFCCSFCCLKSNNC